MSEFPSNLTFEQLKAIKKDLYAQCVLFVESRILAAQDAIKAAQQSANEDSKSSMGDKYETGRAMAQLEIEKNTVQLYEALKLKRTLEMISPDFSAPKIQNGSLVITENGNYYLGISAGKLIHNSIAYFAISSSSPIGQKLLSLTIGDSFDFNGKKSNIISIA